MATLLAQDIDEELVRLLKHQAKAHNRSAEAEHRATLEVALRSGKDAFVARARRMVEATSGRTLADSAVAAVDAAGDAGGAAVVDDRP